MDANLNCPNRDGHVAYGGCSFCSSHGSGDFIGARNESLLNQYELNKKVMLKKWPDSKMIAYFQAYTNTYTSVDNLKRMLEPFLDMDEVVAIDIATRPDCLDEDMINFLDSLCDIKPIWIELGLQTFNDQIAEDFNRAYKTSVFIETLAKLKKTRLKVCVHLINGLPNESRDSMLNNAKQLSDLSVDAIKIHMLHLVRDSRLGQAYLKEPFNLLTLEEYVDIVASQLELINEDIIIERLTGDADSNTLIAPLWTKRKTVVLNDIQKELLRRDSYQGKLAK